MNTERIRVASLQYFIRPVQSFVQFADQVSALVDTAIGYQAQLLVFPEYFSCQLLTLGDVKRPMNAQIRELALQAPRVIDLLSELSRRSGIYIVGGTVPVLDEAGEKVYNDSYVFAPDGDLAFQGKLHMTQFEKEEWLVSPRSDLRVFETGFGRIAIAICYDVEFPEIVRAAAREDAHILVVPSCTDDRQGYLRVRYCAQARAIENQMYVVHSSLVGSLPMVPAVALNYGIAGIFTPSDYAFARDGILAEGMANQESLIVGELNMSTIVDCRSTGTVLPLVDSVRSAEIASRVEVVRL